MSHGKGWTLSGVEGNGLDTVALEGNGKTENVEPVILNAVKDPDV